MGKIKFSRGFLLSEKNPGCLGVGNALLLVSIRNNDDMLGLSPGYSCTHNNPIRISRNTSSH